MSLPRKIGPLKVSENEQNDIRIYSCEHRQADSQKSKI